MHFWNGVFSRFIKIEQKCIYCPGCTVITMFSYDKFCLRFWARSVPRCLLACSSSLDDSSPSARHVFVLASSSGLRGHKRTYLTILESADHALCKMVRYVLLRQFMPILATFYELKITFDIFGIYTPRDFETVFLLFFD
jgi:hypothetical protein